MMTIRFDNLRRVLCLGAHSDDIEIGCGGTVLRLVRDFPEIEFDWVVFSAAGERAVEAKRSAERFLGGARARIILKDFRDGFFPYHGERVKEAFEELKSLGTPDLIFTQYGKDFHQDHRVLSELAWNTFRNHLILEYEIPKYDGGLGSPNLFVQVDESLREKKVRYLLESFESQAGKAWFSGETFSGLMRLRGVESNAPSGYAEGFYCRKICL